MTGNIIRATTVGRRDVLHARTDSHDGLSGRRSSHFHLPAYCFHVNCAAGRSFEGSRDFSFTTTKHAPRGRFRLKLGHSDSHCRNRNAP